MGSELSVSMSGKRMLSKDEQPSAKADADFSISHFTTGAGPMASILPPALTAKVGEFESSKGVSLMPYCTVARISLSEPQRDPIDSRLRLIIHRRNVDNMLLEEIEEEFDHIVIVVSRHTAITIIHIKGL